MTDVEELALWLGRGLSIAEGNATQEILFADIAEQVGLGTPFSRAVGDVTGHDARAGDFGVEVVGSLISVAMLEGLKIFWRAYVKELEEKAGKSAADMSLDFIKARFRADVSGPARTTVGAGMAKAVSASGAGLGIEPAALRPALDAMGAALTSGAL